MKEKWLVDLFLRDIFQRTITPLCAKNIDQGARHVVFFRRVASAKFNRVAR